MSENEKKKRGRPFQESTRCCRVMCRMTDLEAEKLEELCEITGESKSNILRKAFLFYYNRMINRG